MSVFSGVQSRGSVWSAGQKSLSYDQDEIVTRARDELRTLHMDKPDPDRFIEADTFTLTELGEVHFAVLGKENWSIDKFRRKMSRQFRETDQYSQGGPGLPATLYRRRG